jgi:hypothetical protein
MPLKKQFIFATFASWMLISACKKVEHTSTAGPIVDASAEKSFFQRKVLSQGLHAVSGNFRANQSRIVQWDQAKRVQLSSGEALVVPVLYEKKLYVSTVLSGNNTLELSPLTTLVIRKDSANQFHYTLYTFIPDSSAIKNADWNSGIILSEDWQGNSMEPPVRLTHRLADDENIQRSTDGIEVTYEQSIQVCNEIDGYNYSPDDPSAGFAWSETSCTTYNTFLPPLAGTGSGLGDISTVYGILPAPLPLTVNLLPPGNPIGNISAYLRCFTQGDAGHSFTVTLAVEQPVPGSRTPWTFTKGGLSGSSAVGNAFNVGHTWLIFTESTPFGTITRNVGFYPAAIVSPAFRSAQGVLADDEDLAYNIALTVTVNSSQFFGMLQYASQGNTPGYQYDLNSNNCTTFGLDAFDSQNISIPSTIGRWVGNGQGLDPGDLGEDIRSMTLSSNMARSTVSNYHPNTSSCN